MASAGANATDDGELKARLEPGVWRKTVSQAHDSWSTAASSAKSKFLLAGPALAWAENWMLANPDDFTTSEKRFIVRSLAVQSQRSAAGRQQADKEQLKTETRLRWAIIAVAAFTAVRLSSNLVKDGIEYSLNGSTRQQIAARAPIPAPGVVVSVARPVAAPMPGADGEPADGEGEQAAATTAEYARPHPVRYDPTAAPSGTNIPPPSLPKIALKLREQGEARAALLVSVEAIRQAKGAGAAGAEDATEPNPADNLFRLLVKRERLLAGGDAWSPASQPFFCDRAQRIVGAVAGERLDIWDAVTATRVSSTPWKAAPPTSATVDAECTRTLLPADDYAATIVSLSTGRTLARLSGHETDLVGLSFSPDGRTVVTAARDATARLSDAATGRRSRELAGHESGLAGARFNQDGTRAVTWSVDRTAQLWDVASGRPVATLTGHRSAVTDASFARTGEGVVTTSLDGTARLWNGRSATAVAVIEPPHSSIVSATFSEDGRFLATITQADTLFVWNTATVTPTAELTSRVGPTRSIALSADSKWVAATSWSGRVTLWSIAGAASPVELNGVDDPIADVSFARDGASLLAITNAGELLRWPIRGDVDAIVEHAASLAGGCLGSDERKRHGLPRPVPAWCPKVEAAPAEAELPPLP